MTNAWIDFLYSGNYHPAILPASESLRHIEHDLFAIAFALIGGVFGRFIAGKRMAK